MGNFAFSRITVVIFVGLGRAYRLGGEISKLLYGRTISILVKILLDNLKYLYMLESQF